MASNFTPTSTINLASKLRNARIATGMSTRDVSRMLHPRFEISHATIANYEKGKSIPTLDLLAILSGVYERPINWFLESGASLTEVRYRNLKSKVGVGDRHRFEAKAEHLLDAYVRLENRLGERLRPWINITDWPSDEPEDKLAARVRKAAKLALDAPIPSVVALLEGAGVRTLELATDLRIDGLAGLLDGEYVVVLNPSTSNDRCRMNAAHELAHVLFHDCHRPESAGDKKIERRAYNLASHLIMPQQQLEAAIEGRSFVRLVQFKERFGISIAAMVYRAEQCGLLDTSTAKWIWMEFAKRGWRIKEPGHVRPDRATRFEQLLDGALSTKKISWREAESLMGVSESELRQRFDYALGITAVDAEDEEGGDSPTTIRYPM